MRQNLIALAFLVLAAPAWAQEAQQAAPPPADAPLGMAQGPANPPMTGPRLLISTSMGDITLQLDSVRAPKSVANILRYVRKKHYDNTAFYRVAKGFVIQMGSWDAHGKGRGIHPVLAHRHAAQLCAHPGQEIFVATKMGRRVDQVPENYNRDNFRAWNDRSRVKLGVDRLDLVQLHCPPDAVFEDDAVFAYLDEMVNEGRISAYGVSVETCAQALRAIQRPGVATVQIIFNCFRLKPLEEVLPAAQQAGVGNQWPIVGVALA